VTERNVTIYCHCAYYQLIGDSAKSEVLSAIKASGVEFEAVPDLCRMCAERDPALKRWAGAESLRIFACYPRAVKWLFRAGGAPLPEAGVEFVNMRAAGLKFQISNLTFEIGDSKLQEKEPDLQSEDSDLKFEVREGDWIPWFPVIDYDRCESCKRCLDFCLFGVYELSGDDKVEVRNPANCKTNCPACAKTCPNSAIIFPKYSDGPINGDEVEEQASQGQVAKADLADLLSGDIYDTIRKHSKGAKRFSAGAGVKQESSLLKELQGKLDIPPEVLASLSPAEMAGIREKAGKKRSTNEPSKAESEDHE